MDETERTEDPAAASAEETTDEQRVEDDFDALLADVRRERDEYLDLARRAKADFENFRKRSAQQVSDAAKRGRAQLATDLLPVVDSLERALESDPDASAGLAKGVSLVRDQLVATLERAGVSAYDPVGERFDPAWHEALSTAPATDGVEPGVIVEVLDRGYRLDGQVLRPARVVVSE